MPLHVWLPSAHAIAPSHVSAIMSGVIIKMGIYGLLRVTSLVPDPPLAWGVIVLCLGVVSGVLGVAFAIGQHDLKRLLAYHSIENIGIIVIGIGLALVGRSLGRARLGRARPGRRLAARLEPRPVQGASVLRARARSSTPPTPARSTTWAAWRRRCRGPRSASWSGAVAICGLPPLNGFVSEFLIYLGLFGTLGNGDRAGRSPARRSPPRRWP